MSPAPNYVCSLLAHRSLNALHHPQNHGTSSLCLSSYNEYSKQRLCPNKDNAMKQTRPAGDPEAAPARERSRVGGHHG